jgi:3-hydroxyacyl-CoA dehydrogenase
MPVHVNIHGSVAVVTIDNAPVNALSTAIRAALHDLVPRLDADPAIASVVLTGAGSVFVGGADVTEFDRPPEAPALPQVIAAIERSAKPWIAAVAGAALGGGLELALGCQFRIAGPAARFALPEVSLGIIPGAGGTQRLPRLIGVAAALAMVAENRELDALAAVELGLVDQLIDGPFLDDAIDFAAQAAERPRRPFAPAPTVEEPFWRDAEARIARLARGSAAPLAAFHVLRLGLEQGIEAGLDAERETFLALRSSEEAAALRHLFFAERAALRPKALRGTSPIPVSRVGIVGGGTMGAGIAAAMLAAGFEVAMVERDDAALAGGLERLRTIVEGAARKGGLPVQAALARLEGATDYSAVGACDLVVEAVFEDLEVKREVFARLARSCSPDTVLATNTSYLDPRLIAEELPHPERFVGLHFFSPAHVMKLLEIVPVPQTRPNVLATAVDLARRLGKIPVQSGLCEGFIGNRILRRARAEAEAMFAEGIAVEAIDAAMRGYGFAMGPFEVQDLAGLDIAFRHREAVRAQGRPVPEVPGDVLVRAGRTGQKAGAGWYDYKPGDRTPHPSPDAMRLLASFAGCPRTVAPGEIVTRLLAAMADEGEAILREGIAASPGDIDLVEVHGYGFPRRRGGPMFQASRRSGIFNTA